MIPRHFPIVRAMFFATLLSGLAVGQLARHTGSDVATSTVFAAPVSQERGESPCIIVSRASVVPDIVLQGEAVSVTLNLAASCPPVTPTIHIGLVLDGSAAMSGHPNRQTKVAMRNLVQQLDLADNPGVQVGVVSHGNGSADTLCELSNRAGTVNGCLGRLGAAGAPDLDGAIDEARQLITRGRRGIESPDEVREIVLIVSGSAIAGNGCTDVQRSAAQLKNQGVLVMTACASNDCDEQCLRQTATSPRYFFDELDETMIANVFGEIVRQAGNPALLKTLTVTETLGADVSLVADSAQPAPNEISPDGKVMEWRTSFVPREGITLSFQAMPSRLGPQTMASGKGYFTDNSNGHGAFEFPPQSVMVLAPDPVFTATPEGPDPSATPVPQDTPTVEPEDTPTAEVREYRNYLPLVIRNHEL